MQHRLLLLSIALASPVIAFAQKASPEPDGMRSLIGLVFMAALILGVLLFFASVIADLTRASRPRVASSTGKRDPTSSTGHDGGGSCSPGTGAGSCGGGDGGGGD